MTADGYWKNPQGDLVNPANVREEDKLEDELVRRMIASAEALEAAIASFKSAALDEAAAFKALVAEKYGAKKGGAKGNMTLSSYDGTLEMQVAVSDSLSFGVELQAAKELIDNCVERWSEGSNANLQALVNDAFQVGKAGRIDTGRVLGLRRLDIDDDEWRRAMDAISDAVRVVSSKTYVRFYRRDPKTDARTPISVDIAKV